MAGLSSTAKQQIAAALAEAAHGDRGAVVKRLADLFKVSPATIYRLAGRNGTKRSRAPAKPEYRDWVRIAVGLAQLAPKGLPLDLAITAGIESGKLPDAARELPLQTAYRIAGELNLKKRPARTHRMHADYPMQAVQVDGSTSEYLIVDQALPDGDYLLKLHRRPTPTGGYKNKPLKPHRLRLQVYSVWDMCTGYQLARYDVGRGESAIGAMDFLCWALAQKDDCRIPFHGVPDDLWTDQGPLFKSAAATDLLERLDINLVTGLAYAKERMGGVERTHRTRWNRFEQSLFLRGADTMTLSELNQRLVEFLIIENSRHQSRTPVAGQATDRASAWVALTNGRPALNPLRRLPDNPIATMAQEARRFVDQNGILRWQGEYEVSRLHSTWVIARRAMDNIDNIVVEVETTGEKQIAMPYLARPYGEIVSSPKSELEKLKAKTSSYAGVDLFAPAISGSATDHPGNLFRIAARSSQPSPLDNPLDAHRYSTIGEAMMAFQAICPAPLSDENRRLVVQRIEEAGLDKEAVRELAQDLNGIAVL